MVLTAILWMKKKTKYITTAKLARFLGLQTSDSFAWKTETIISLNWLNNAIQCQFWFKSKDQKKETTYKNKTRSRENTVQEVYLIKPAPKKTEYCSEVFIWTFTSL